jgi:hypothetical protein
VCEKRKSQYTRNALCKEYSYAVEGNLLDGLALVLANYIFQEGSAILNSDITKVTLLPLLYFFIFILTLSTFLSSPVFSSN